MKQRDLLKETADFASGKPALSEGESLVNDKEETTETSEKSILQHKNTKVTSSLRKGNASSNNKVKQVCKEMEKQHYCQLAKLH